MKAIKIYGLLIGLACLMGACDSYLDVELQNQITLEEVFSSRGTTEQYLANVYSYLPKEHDMFTDGSVVARSDEAHFSWLSGIDWLNFINGSWTTSLWAYNTWADSYEGINQATVFMNNIENVPDEQISQTDKAIMKAEARFIRAYLYFSLLRKYGPVFVWGDQDADNLIRPESIDRHPLETNVEFILSEYDKAIAILPTQISDVKWYGRITKGMAMAAKSRMTLYMARPLFNGCTLYKGMKNKDGEFIFPQTPDPSKWEDAARAAKAVIYMGIYELYEDKTETDPFKRSIRSYMDVIFEQWNSEIIWGRFWDGGWEYNVRCAPPKVVREGYGGYCPSMKLVDTYPMSESGRYPVTGYQSNGYPIVDPLSGYSNEGFTENYLHPLDDFATIKAHNNCVGRDARFYASILANGMYWLNTYKGQKLVTFYDGGTSSYATAGDVVKVGFLWRRMFNPIYNHEDGSWGTICWPVYRLAEIYLNYAEACNEKPNRDEAEALKYINKVRNRVGLNNLEVAYPEVKGNQELFRKLIMKERMVELAFEGHRYYDSCTWMTAVEESDGPMYTLNLAATDYESSWERTDKIWPHNFVFKPAYYLFPMNQSQLNEMQNYTQNYGW